MKLHTVSHLNSNSVFRVIDQVGMSNSVLLRVFDRSRVPLALQMGTDRALDSREYSVPGVDARPEDRLAAGLDQSQVTYAHEVDLKTRQRLSHSYSLIPLDLHLDSLEGNQTSTAVALYDPTKAVRAPGSEVEFWFPSNPQEALLAVIIGQG